MKNKQKIALTCFFIASVALVAGCSGSKESTTTETASRKKPIVRDHVAELNDAQALQHFINGVTLDAKDRYAEAILEYQEVLQLEPNAATYYAISRDYALLGKMGRASEAARKAVDLDSTKVAYRENLASMYLNQFQQDSAVAQYEAIVRIDSNSTANWLNLARLYQQKQPLKALAICERLLESNPQSWDVLLQAAELCSNLGQFDRAAGYYQQMLEIDPGNRPLQRQLAETYTKAGKIDKAVKLLEEMHDQDQNDVEVSAILGEVYLQQGEYEKALPLYQALLKQVKSNPEIKLRVGVAYVGQIQRDSTFADKAKQIFEQLEKDLPNDFRVYFYLGIIASNQKQDSLAGTYFERVTSLDEKNGEAWWFLGNNYFERGEFQQLLKSMEKARALFPKDSRFYLLTGLAYSRLGQPDPAIYDGLKEWQTSDSLYEEALKVDSTSSAAAIILNNYGYSLAGRRIQLDRALRMAKKAVAMEPNNASYLDTLGWVYFVLGNYTEAHQYIAKAVATGEASAEVTEHLGDVYFKLGNKDKALEYWQQALNMDKTNKTLQEKIERGSL
jgi:pentatricopeptide repeat protein